MTKVHSEFVDLLEKFSNHNSVRAAKTSGYAYAYKKRDL